MSQDIFCIDTNNDICDAVGCSTKATEEIAVPDGTFGNIKLLLCSNCVSKFSYVSRGKNDLEVRNKASANAQNHIVCGKARE